MAKLREGGHLAALLLPEGFSWGTEIPESWAGEKKGLGQLLLLALMEFTGEGGCSHCGENSPPLQGSVCCVLPWAELCSWEQPLHWDLVNTLPHQTKIFTICWVPQGNARILERGRCVLSSLMEPTNISDSTCSLSANGTPGLQIVLERPFLLLTP